MIKLNKEQQEACDTLNGPLLVIAGAGSGKSATIIERIDNLVKTGVLAQNIVAISFTNKAANELKERLSPMAQDVEASTIHSFCLNILRHYLRDPLNNLIPFTIMDTDESKQLIRDIFLSIYETVLISCEENNEFLPTPFDEYSMQKSSKTISIIASNISKAKNAAVLPYNYLLFSNEKDLSFPDLTFDIYSRYVNICEQQHTYDFDDILIKTYMFLHENPTVLAIIQNKYKYITIDEYQDTNSIQDAIINLIAQKYRNLCVVGDPDQSIYGFRGAEIKNILTFNETYPDAKIIKLFKNYRSEQQILNTANDVIVNNKHTEFSRDSLKGLIKTDNKPKVIYYNKPEDEATGIVESIIKNHAKGRAYKDIAVLFRNRIISKQIEAKLISANIPYELVGQISFYDRQEIKDMLSYLKVLANRDFDIPLKRIINVPPKLIGMQTIKTLSDWQNSQIEPKTFLDSVLNHANIATFRPETSKNLDLFIEVYSNAHNHARKIGDLARYFYRSFRYDEYIKTLSNSEEREKNIALLFDILDKFDSETPFNDTIPAYDDLWQRTCACLDSLYLKTITDRLLEDKTSDRVTLMTVHSSKGLEFEQVIIAGLEEGTFPSSFALKDKDQILEERRLMYVALTRAKKDLTLTVCLRRNLYGNFGESKPSRFINEINEANIIVDKSKFNVDTPSKTNLPISRNPFFKN